MCHTFNMKYSLRARAAHASFLNKTSAFALAFLLLTPSLVPVAAFAQTADASSTDTGSDASGTSSSDTTSSDSASSSDSSDTSGSLSGTVSSSSASSLAPSSSSPVGGSATIPSPLDPLTSKQVTPNVNETSGSLNYSYPLTLPPGRNGLTPDLSLTYDSQNQKAQTIVGYGWNVGIPFIQRVTKHGSEQLYTGTYQDFTSSASGDLVQTASAGTSDPDEGTYGAQSESGDFLVYTYSSGVWTATDKKGVIYTYGMLPSDRQDDAANPNHIYKWMLSEIRDANNNFITYTYYKDAGQIYPDTITYTGNGSTPGIFQVVFSRSPQAGVFSDMAPGFSVNTNYILSKATISVSGINQKEYDFNYTAGQNGVRELLTSVGEKDLGTGTVRTTGFSYTTNRTSSASSLGFSNTISLPTGVSLLNCNINGYAIMQCGGRFADLNGDGLPDYVAAAADINSWGTATFTYMERDAVYFNTGTGFVPASWTFPVRTIPASLTLVGTTATHVSFYDQYYLPGPSPVTNMVLADVNNDGKADLIKQNPPGSGSSTNPICADSNPWEVYINNGSGWVLDTSWSGPSTTCGGINLSGDVTQIQDVNGDGWPDVVTLSDDYYLGGLEQKVFLNDHAGNWTYASGWNVDALGATIEWPAAFHGGALGDSGFTRLMDINHDGLPDLVVAIRTTHKEDLTNVPNTPPTGTPDQGEWYYVFMNTGHNWIYDSAAEQLPTDGTTFYVSQLSYPTVHAAHAEFEAADEYNLSPYYPRVYVNNMYDFDGDGEADLNEGTSQWVSAGSTGWTPDSFFGSVMLLHSGPNLYFQNGTLGAAGTPMADFNGDGIIDYYAEDSSSGFSPREILNTNKPADLLTQVTLPDGGTVAVTYKSAAQYTDTSGNLLNPDLPSIIQTVNSITTADPVLGVSGTVHYTYEGGSYFTGGSFDRKFAGFHIVTKTDDLGNTTKTYYHTGSGTDTGRGEYADDEAKIGKVYRVEQYDGSGNMYTATINKWDGYVIGTDHEFVKLARTTTETFDGLVVHRDTSQEYSYDNTNGNVLQKIDWGEVTAMTDGSFTDIGTDKSVENVTYATPTTGSVIGLPSDDTVLDQFGATVRETRDYYDGLSLGSVSTGNQTKEEKLKSGTTFVSTKKTYGTDGFVTSSTDENTNTTTYTPDAYHLYPARVTEAVGGYHKDYLYDYVVGKPSQVTDENSFVYNTNYDAFGRTVSEFIPDPSLGTSVLKTSYIYVDTPLSTSVHTIKYLDSSTQVDTYQYLDGLGRLIQTRRSSEVSGTYNVSDTAYNSRGLKSQESLPYTSSGSARTSPTGTTALYTTYAYDPIKRVTSSTNAAGTTTTMYHLWSTTVTDPMSHIKIYHKDARDNLIMVYEHLGTTTYSTTYGWDLNGKLTSITDTLNNVRNFTYDDLGRRITAEDLHDPADTTFGTWTYAYDNAGNMTQSVSPNGATVNYTYDGLNRRLTENWTGGAGTEIRYAYDTCTNGITKLCSVTMLSGANTNYQYDADGNISNESKTITGTTTVFAASHVYDRQGNQVTLTYPDGAEAQYTYNTAGQIEKIERKEAGGSFTDVVSNFDYSPTDQPATIAYANGVTTTNTYDASHLYRLSNKTTINGTSVHLQDAAYSYDPDGNIITLTDTSANDNAKVVNYTYDDLNRLLTANTTSVASGTPTYAQTFTYDPIGNIASGPLGAYSYTGSSGTSYANPHAVTSAGTVTYTYDNDGNLLTDSSLSDAWNYVWNYKDQAKEIDYGTAAQYELYDYDGTRVAVSTPSSWDYYPMSYYVAKGSGDLEKDIYAGSELVATVETVGTTVTPHYVHTDNVLGSNVVTDSTGTQEQLVDYYPYGSIRLNQQATSFNEGKKFGGHYSDETQTGLNYFGARYYDPAVSRFVSEDPSFLAMGEINQGLDNPQSLNSYSYANGNPITNIDPDGRNALDFLAGSLNAFASNFWLGAGRVTYQNYGGNQSDYAGGQRLGDGASVAWGGVETSLGDTIGTGGVAISSTGVGALAGVPAAALGAAMVSHGVGIAATAAYNLSANDEVGEGDSNRSTAESIGSGHAYDKHVVKKEEFKGIVNTKSEFIDHIDNVINNPSDVKSLSRDRTAYYHNDSQTTVIHDPNHPDQGTALRTGSKNYFNSLK